MSLKPQLLATCSGELAPSQPLPKCGTGDWSAPWGHSRRSDVDPIQEKSALGLPAESSS